MVWACFWKEGNMIKRSNLYIMDRDFESKKHGYSARSYIQVLDDNIPSIWQPGLFFMQDNAPIHMANSVRKWFEDIGIPLEDHPPYSPDLNPIEHLWWHLKNKALQLHPELQDLGVGEQALQALERALIEAWEAIPDSIFEACLNSMPKRVQAVIDADGWHTKY
jgi:transposase